MHKEAIAPMLEDRDLHPNHPQLHEGSHSSRCDLHGLDGDTDETDGPRIRLKRVSELGEAGDVTELVEDALTAGTVNLLVGRSLSGKSHIAAHLGSCIARGARFFDRAVLEGGVLYLCFEGQVTFGSRMKAMASEMTPNEYDLFDTRFQLMEHPKPLIPGRIGQGSVVEIIENVRELEARSGVPCRLVVLDTLFAALPGQNTNEASIMTQAYDFAKKISDTTGAATIYVHHPGHTNQNRPQGAYPVVANYNSIWLVHVGCPAEDIHIPPGHVRTLNCDKWKDGANENPVVGKFDIGGVEIGTKKNGMPATAGVARILGVGGDMSRLKPKKSWKPTGRTNSVWKVIQDVYAAGLDEDVPMSSIGLENVASSKRPKAIVIEALYQRCLDAKFLPTEGKTASQIRQEFERALDRLRDHGWIGRCGDYAWLPDQQRTIGHGKQV